jgi:hypothetical protein
MKNNTIELYDGTKRIPNSGARKLENTNWMTEVGNEISLASMCRTLAIFLDNGISISGNITILGDVCSKCFILTPALKIEVDNNDDN